ncbi:hypothetical protein KVC60_06025 [Helicobacter pylori]|uniref:hypothetical protein n=1 Tax=Helicobacter pylori TaxID=210 RepID=UPI00165BA056|nr:hypothetical protein [Helicobacter pylori]WQS20527.1 hypothetical protein KVC60_06025 [Helicobacter pylori]WQS29865.1 hypothetical protein KVE56_06030 [Helicobacter pylori]
MLLNYDFLEFVDEPQRNTSLTSAIDKALADKKLARQNKPRVKIKEGLSLRATLDAFGDELSRLKNAKDTTIKGSTIESASLNSIVKKIQSGLPFGTISAFRPFKEAFIKDFTKKQRELLIASYKSGYRKDEADKIMKLWQDQYAEIDWHKPIKANDFFKGNTNIYRTLRNIFGQKFMDRYTAPNSKATMKDFMSSDKFVKKYRNTYKDNIERTKHLKLHLDSWGDFVGYIQVIGYWKDNLKDTLLPDKEVSFFVFQNEPSIPFSLKNHLLLLARLFNQMAICYCDNAKTGKVDLILATQEDFGKVDWTFTGTTFSAPNPLPQSLTRLHNSVYTFFKKEGKDNYGVFFDELSKTQIKAMNIPKNDDGFYRQLANGVKSFIKARQYHGSPRTFNADDIEKYELQAIKERENRKKVLNASFRQSYENALKVNKLVNAMLKGKKVSKTLVANTIDTDAGYCFISPTDLATQLANIRPRVSKSIVTAIEQAEGVRLNYALIDKITYNSLHNTLSFVFDIDNPLSDQSLDQLVIEVPREALKNVKLPQIKNVLTAQIFDGAYHFRNNGLQSIFSVC